jgi:ribosomal subunit interface protein
MEKSITFANMEPTTLLEAHVNEQLIKIERFLERERPPVFLEVILKAHRTHAHHEVSVRLQAPEYHLRAHAEGADMYKVISEAIDKLYAELRREKEKWVDRHKNG